MARPLIFVCVTLLSVSSVASQPAVSPIALTAVVSTATGNPPKVSVQVINNSQKTATAWTVETTFVFADKAPRVDSATTQEFYMVLAVPTGSAHGPLPPGQARSIPMELPERNAERSVHVAAVAVVYDDQTAEGDPARIDEIFTRRAEDWQAYREVVAQVRGLIQRGVSATAMQDLIDDLKSPRTPGAAASARSLAASNLAMILSEDRTQPELLAHRTAGLLDLLERYERAAQIHSHRK